MTSRVNGQRPVESVRDNAALVASGVNKESREIRFGLVYERRGASVSSAADSSAR